MASKFYAAKGEEKRLFSDWESCKAFLEGKKGYKYKSFSGEEEARSFLDGKDYAKDRMDADLADGFAVAYTDGSFDERANAYSYGVAFISPNGEEREFCNRGEEKAYLPSRNVSGEVLGVLAAVKFAFLNGYDKLKIYHDYEGLSAWATGRWGAKSAISCFYVETLRRYEGGLQISFEKVKGHANNSYNERVDKLAKAALFDGQKKVVDGLGFKVSGNGEYETLLEYLKIQNRRASIKATSDSACFSTGDDFVRVFRKRGSTSVVGNCGKLYASAVGFFFRYSTVREFNRLIERSFDFNYVSEPLNDGFEITEFLLKNVKSEDFASFILFSLIEMEKRIMGSLKSQGFGGEKISKAFAKDGDGFETVFPIEGGDVLAERYAFFYKYRIAFDSLRLDAKECASFCAAARKLFRGIKG